jgi:hypothetical protein
MAAGSSGARPLRRRVHAWLRWFAVAATVLVFSESVWIWQTLPVRELLQMQTTVPGRTGAAR